MNVDLPEITRRQLLVWAVIGLAVIAVGVRFLASEGDRGAEGIPPPVARTVGLKDEPPAAITIHIVGAVVAPGLYDLEKGDRVADAIAVAGGPLPTADLSRINLAAKVADGQQLAVPATGETAVASAAPAGADALINLNAATLEELSQLDGIGPKTAQKIIDYREEQGGFDHIEELMDVPGIGPAKFDQVKDRIIV